MTWGASFDFTSKIWVTPYYRSCGAQVKWCLVSESVKNSNSGSSSSQADFAGLLPCVHALQVQGPPHLCRWRTGDTGDAHQVQIRSEEEKQLQPPLSAEAEGGVVGSIELSSQSCGLG